MKSVAAKQAKDQFGQLLDTARTEPVAIQKHGRDVAVVLSIHDYQRLAHAEDQLWAAKAAKAEKKGFMSTRASEAFLRDLLDAKG